MPRGDLPLVLIARFYGSSRGCFKAGDTLRGLDANYSTYYRKLEDRVMYVRVLLGVYHSWMPENVRRAIVEAIDSAEAVKASLAREVDPVLRSLANRSQAGLEARVLEKA